MRSLTAIMLGTGLLCGLIASAANAQMSPGPVIGPAVTSEAGRQAQPGAADAMPKKDMEQAKDKMDEKQKDAEKKAEEHKDKPKSN